MMNGTVNDVDPSSQLFDQLISAVTCKSILSTFHDLVDCLGISNTDHRNFYKQLKTKLTSWKANSLWVKLDKRAAHRDYKKMEACKNTKVLVIGAGPCGLRMAIEVALLGAKAVVVEKRDRFSRNNVLHLWNFVIADLRNLGAKKFFGKFCAGSIEHISIRQLQCILLKVALLLGVEVHVNVAFEELIEPPEDQSTSTGWRCRLTPRNHPVSEYQFDALLGADGKRNTVPGFPRKEFRGKLAIAITANFINRNSNAEARVEEISGVAFIFNQKFFLDLKEKTGIDLENIVYYKDETHYFVMTAKKASLREKGVLKEDYSDTIQLLSRENVDQDALLNYAEEAANFSTNHQLPCLEYAVNHYGQADIAMFDFTSMFAAENACRAIERNGHRLFIGIAGDSLLEPFWPTGSGCARGFLGVFDAAWMIKSMASGKMTPLQVIAERESIYQLLSQTTPENLHKNHNQYSIDPNTRYPNLNFKNRLKPIQVKNLFDGPITDLLIEEAVDDIPAKRPRHASSAFNNDLIDSYSLLRWCQRVLNSGRFRNVHVVDFAGSWRSGLAFCALIHAFRPDSIDFNLLMESDVAKNNQLAFDVAEKELSVPPVMTGEDMAKSQIPDKLTLVSYISQLYAIFRSEPLPTVCDALEFCEKTGCYVRVTKPEDDLASALPPRKNPFSMISGRHHVKTKPADDLASAIPPRKNPFSMIAGRHHVKRQLSYDKLPDWVKNAAILASESEDSGAESDGTSADGSITSTMWEKLEQRQSCGWCSDSTDDEDYRPRSVQSLKKLYEGPRGYTVSAQRREKDRKIEPSEKEMVMIDDSEFKTLTQDDVESYVPFEKSEISELIDDDAYKTLTQEDMNNFRPQHEELVQKEANEYKTLTQEDVQNFELEQKHSDTEIVDDDVFNTGSETDVNMLEAEADVESSSSSSGDDDDDDGFFMQPDVNFLKKKWKNIAGLDEVVPNEKETARVNNTNSDKNLSQVDQTLLDADKETLVDVKKESPRGQETDDRQDDIELTMAGKESSDNDFLASEVMPVSEKGDAVTRIKEFGYRYSDMVMLPGLAPNNESSTDDVEQVMQVEKSGKSDTEEGKVKVDEIPTVEGDEDSETINFKAAKRKFQDLSRDNTSSSKKVDRRSSTRSPRHANSRSHMDIMKDNHPKVAGMMSLDHGEVEGETVTKDENQLKAADSTEADADILRGDGKVAPELTLEAVYEEGTIEFIAESEYRESRVVDLGGELETESSTDVDVQILEVMASNLESVAEMDTSKSQELCQQFGTETVPVDEDPENTVTTIPDSTFEECHEVEAEIESDKDCKEQETGQDGSSGEDETGTVSVGCSSSDDEFFDAEEHPSLDNTNKDVSMYSQTPDIDDSQFQTAYDFSEEDSKLASNSDANMSVCDTDASTIDEDCFTTATGSQLASRLQLVSVSEDCVTSEDLNVSSSDGPEETPASEDTIGDTEQKVSSKTCSVA